MFCERSQTSEYLLEVVCDAHFSELTALQVDFYESLCGAFGTAWLSSYIILLAQNTNSCFQQHHEKVVRQPRIDGDRNVWWR